MSQEEMNDFELIERAKNGDNSAFQELVKRYESQVAATVISMVGKTDVADDIGQEVFIRFYKVLHKYRGDASPGSYLTRIAINLCINEINKRKRRRLFFKSDHEPLPDIADDPEEGLERDEKKALVQKAIQKLPPKFRSVVVLRFIDGYSTQETAEILKLPLGTVLSRLSRGQDKLKEILSPLILEEV